MERVYLDYAASTPVDPRVLQTMLPYFSEIYGNPSSMHQEGQRAEAALEGARAAVAAILNCTPAEIVFTGCGSESDNLALRGVALRRQADAGCNHLLITPVEHHAVSRTARALAAQHGFEVERLPVDEFGRTSAADVAARLRPTTALVSVIYGNNEIGSLNPIAAIGQVCRAHGVPFHSDAVQAAAYESVDVQALQVDLLALGAHKFYGPKGVGALYIRAGTPIGPAQTGGAQESGRRAGTHNTPLIIGLAAALELTAAERVARRGHLLPLRDRLLEGVLAAIPDSRLTGHPTDRLPNHASFVLRAVDGNRLLRLLDLEGFAVASGSACRTGNPKPSSGLLSLGLTPEWALGSLRVTLGTHTTLAQIDRFLEVLPVAVARARQAAEAAG
jgi:cysteine desulfurase